MLRHHARRVLQCQFRPEMLSLEDRLTPTINSLTVLGVAPSLSGAGSISLIGLIQDSYQNPVESANLTVSYEITDTHGHVLNSGPLNVRQMLPNTTLLGFTKQVPVSVNPGQTEIITVTATDVDGTIVASTALTVPTGPKWGNASFSTMAANGDSYSGSAQGRIALCSTPAGRYMLRGAGTFQVYSGPNNGTPLNARGQGHLDFGFSPDGSVALAVTNSHATLNYGSYAGDTTANGGVTVSVRGNLCIARAATGALKAKANGTISLAADLNRNAPPNQQVTLTGSACLSAVHFQIDPQGVFQLGIAGRLRLGGRLPLNIAG